MNEDLLKAFSTKPAQVGANLESVPISVKGYILPAQGQAETPENTRVLGVRWDTGEPVEIALRALEGGMNRPLVAQFKDDSNSSTPVTTAIGGTIIVEAAFHDASLPNLSNNPSAKVLSGRWLNRVSPNQEEGWAIRTLARVNEPRFIDANNPASGKTQTITMMAEKLTTPVSTLAQLDNAVLNALDAAARDLDTEWFKRPGAVNVFVRLSTTEENNLIEMSGGFHQPAGRPHSIPKSREMVAAELANSKFWQQKRAVLEKALANPNYKVEVIPGSTIFVGRKTLQKSLQSNNSPIKGVSREIDGANVALFTDSVIGIRKSPTSGLPQALSVMPAKRLQMASKTGMPTPAEKHLFGLAENPTQSAANAQPSQQASSPGQAAPVATNVQAEPAQLAAQQTVTDAIPSIVVSPSRQDSTKLAVFANHDANVPTLKQAAEALQVVYSGEHKAIRISNMQLPTVMQIAKRNGSTVHVNAPELQQAQAPIQATPVTSPHSAPEQEAKPIAAPSAAPNEPPFIEPVDLSQLDLSNLDLDSVLNQAYDNSPSRPTR